MDSFLKKKSPNLLSIVEKWMYVNIQKYHCWKKKFLMIQIEFKSLGESGEGKKIIISFLREKFDEYKLNYRVK